MEVPSVYVPEIIGGDFHAWPKLLGFLKAVFWLAYLSFPMVKISP